MRKISVFVITIIIFGTLQTTNAQTDELDMQLEVSDEEKIILFCRFCNCNNYNFFIFSKRHHT